MPAFTYTSSTEGIDDPKVGDTVVVLSTFGGHKHVFYDRVYPEYVGLYVRILYTFRVKRLKYGG